MTFVVVATVAEVDAADERDVVVRVGPGRRSTNSF